MEWYLPDRRIVVPAECDLSKAAEFLVSHTARYPELVLTFEDDAKELFDFLETSLEKLNVRPDSVGELGKAQAEAAKLIEKQDSISKKIQDIDEKNR